MQALKILPLFALLTGCGAQVIVASPSSCSALIPQSWRVPVPGAPLPPYVAVVADWIAFGDAQTGQLDKANGRTVDALDVIGRCEARDAAAVRKARPKVLGIF